MTPAFRQLLNRYAMLAFERELAWLDQLGEGEERLSLSDGTADFGDGRVWPVQLLGSHADEDDSWMWAWNQEKALPKGVITAVKKVRQTGRKREVPELIEAEYPLEPLELDPHALALVATSIAELPVYYRFPYRGGALFAALEVAGFELAPADPERIAMVIREVCSRFPLEPRTAVETYLRGRDATAKGGREELVGTWPDGRRVVARFNADGGLLEAVPAAGGAVQPGA